MAQRRMFNKSITNSSKFLKMPMSSRLLYYDLGMNADDDGFVEHFMVLRMTGASEQDLGVLEVNGLVKIFDENVLWIKDWKENNYVRNDRYQPSKYLSVYNLDTIGIPLVDTGKVRLGKDSIEYNIIDTKIKTPTFKKPTLKEVESYCKERDNHVDPQRFIDFYESKGWMVGKNKMKDWKACIRTWEQKCKEDGTIPTWFYKENEKKETTEDDIKEMEELLKI